MSLRLPFNRILYSGHLEANMPHGNTLEADPIGRLKHVIPRESDSVPGIPHSLQISKSF